MCTIWLFVYPFEYAHIVAFVFDAEVVSLIATILFMPVGCFGWKNGYDSFMKNVWSI